MESHISCSTGDVACAAIQTALGQDRATERTRHFDRQGICVWTTANLTDFSILRVLLSRTFIVLIVSLMVGLSTCAVFIYV